MGCTHRVAEALYICGPLGTAVGRILANRRKCRLPFAHTSPSTARIELSNTSTL